MKKAKSNPQEDRIEKLKKQGGKEIWISRFFREVHVMFPNGDSAYVSKSGRVRWDRIAS